MRPTRRPVPVGRAPRPMRIGVLLVALLVLVAPQAASATPLATDEPLVTFGIGPAGAERPDPRAFLGYGLAPGAQITDNVAVFNQSDTPLTLQLYAADAVAAEDGGLDVLPGATASTDVGSWVQLGTSARTVTVPAQSVERGVGSVVVPVTISVPATAIPGDHTGALVASLVASGAGAGQNVELEQRVATRMYVRVAGEASPSLSVQVLSSSWDRDGWLGPGTLRLTYRVTNTGNTRLGALTRVDVSGPFGLGRVGLDAEPVEELVPGGSVLRETTVDGVWPLVTLGGRVTVAAVAAPGAEEPGIAPVSAGLRLWAWTWETVALLALLLALATWAVRHRRRSSGPGPGASVGGRHRNLVAA